MAAGPDTEGRFLHRNLQPLVLHGVTHTGKTIGSGSYGNIVEVAIPGALCAAKKIHDWLTKQDPDWLAKEVADSNVQKFLSECTMMSRLRHPHIVQFLGLWFDADSSLYLVMEKMMTSLHNILEPDDPKSTTAASPNIPLGVKISILQDIARGLAFLHKQSPPVIHRDLSARNVLLNSAMTAKIADLGMARIMPPKLKATMTKAPGAYIYMPPEALEDVSKYNASIDIFSLGVLIIFVLAETFPDNPKAPTYTDEVKGLLARTELQRRENYTLKLYREFTKTHPLIQLMESCLDNMPKRRPTVDGVQQILGQAAAQVQGEAQLHKLQLLQMLMENEEQLKDLTKRMLQLKTNYIKLSVQCVQLQKQLTDESKECEQMRQRLAEEMAINARMEEAHRKLQVQLEATMDERGLQAIRDRMERYRSERDQLKMVVSQYQEREQEHQETIHSLQVALEEVAAQNSNQDSTSAWQDQVASLTLQLEDSNKRMLRYREERNTARIMHKSLQEQINTLQPTIEQLQNSRSYNMYTSGQLDTALLTRLQLTDEGSTERETVKSKPPASPQHGVQPYYSSQGAAHFDQPTPSQYSVAGAHNVHQTGSTAGGGGASFNNLSINTSGSGVLANRHQEEMGAAGVWMQLRQAQAATGSGAGVIMGGGGAIGIPAGLRLPAMRVLCKTAGCTFYAKPELENLCTNCYEDYYDD